MHSGDPSLWGAVQEQYDRCVRLGLDVEIVPGVSAFSAVAAIAGRELTVPEVAQSVILTRLEGGKTPMPDGEQIREFARHGTTMAVFLSAARSGQLRGRTARGRLSGRHARRRRLQGDVAGRTGAAHHDRRTGGHGEAAQAVAAHAFPGRARRCVPAAHARTCTTPATSTPTARPTRPLGARCAASAVHRRPPATSPPHRRGRAAGRSVPAAVAGWPRGSRPVAGPAPGRSPVTSPRPRGRRCAAGRRRHAPAARPADRARRSRAGIRAGRFRRTRRRSPWKRRQTPAAPGTAAAEFVTPVEAKPTLTVLPRHAASYRRTRRRHRRTRRRHRRSNGRMAAGRPVPSVAGAGRWPVGRRSRAHRVTPDRPGTLGADVPEREAGSWR